MIKKQQYQTMLIVLVVILIGWFVFKNTGKKAEAPSDSQGNTTDNKNNSGADTGSKTPTPATMASDKWEGTLQLSNNSAKGNLMLVTKDRNIYIKTSRDYSALIGKEVVVSYSGTLDSFGLGDITAK